MSRTEWGWLALTAGSFVFVWLIVSHVECVWRDTAHALVDTPNLIVIEPGDREHCVEMPADAGNGRVVQVRGVVLGPKWAPRDVTEQEVLTRNVAIPATTRKREAPLFRDARIVVCLRIEEGLKPSTP